MGKKISLMDPAGAFEGQEMFEMVQKGKTVKGTAAQMAEYALGVYNLKVWGVRKEVGSASLFWERVNPAIHAERRVHKYCGRYLEDSLGNKTDLHPTDSRKTKTGATVDLSGSQGNIWWRKPAYYFKAEILQDPNGKWYEYQWMSDHYFDGAIYMQERSCSPWHMCVNRATSVAASLSFLTWAADGSIARDVNGFPVYTANAATYRGGNNNVALDGTASSQLGMCTTAYTRASARANALAAGAHCGWFSILDEIRILYRFDYACDDIQQAYNSVLDINGNRQGGLGAGKNVPDAQWSAFNAYYPFIPMGVTCPLGNQSGVVSYTIKNWAGVGVDKIISVDSFLGLEALSEYIHTQSDDLLFYFDTALNKIKAYYCSDKTKFANPASDVTTVVPVGYKHICDMPLVDGSISAMSLPPLSLPTSTVGGASNKYVPDYYYHPTTAGWFCPGFGGSAVNGSSAGLACLNAGSRVSFTSAAWGFRLCR